MTGEHVPVHAAPPTSAVPAPRRPASPPVWSFHSSGSPARRYEGPATEKRPQARVPDRADAGAALNSRDLEVLSGLARGRSTAQIASSLSVSRNTARTRIRRVQGKLDVEGRSAAVRAAQGLGILTLVPSVSLPD
jgi:DNA-binding CsgD family transcriptional regulator